MSNFTILGCLELVKKFVVVGGWWVESEFSVLLWSKPFFFRLRFWTWTKPNKSVLFAPPTPGGILAKELKKREEEVNRYSEDRIKILEKGGINMEAILTKKNPFKASQCLENSCPLCSNVDGEMRNICNTNNVGYKWTCKNCEKAQKMSVYKGEKPRPGRLRGGEHLKYFLRDINKHKSSRSRRPSFNKQESRNRQTDKQTGPAQHVNCLYM